ncbi:MAG: HD domain-containing phosphohydrolase [Candidatus Phosphoribacter sp.]|nr:HD domain-containing protein [Actinomycetales bacterium]
MSPTFANAPSLGSLARRARPPTRTGRWLVGACVTIAAASLVRASVDWRPLVQTWPVLAAFAVVIALGELVRFGIDDGRHLAPMSLGAAFALSLTSRSGSFDLSMLGPAHILAVTSTAMILGATINRLRGRPAHPEAMASRFTAVLVTTLLFRWLPVADTGTLLHLESTWVGSRWPVAVLMGVVSGLGLLVFLVVSAVVIAARAPSWRVGQTLVDGLRAGAGLGMALSATGALIALAERPLGVLALPLFLTPLVLTQFALRQYAASRRTYVQTVRVLSRLTEMGGFTRAGHSDRVAALSLEIGRDLGLSERDIRHLQYAALLHDIGQVALREPIPGGATVMAARADQQRIALDGAEIVRKTGVPAEVAAAVEQQATPYRVVREQRQDLPLASRIIKVANAYDDIVGGSITSRRREAAMERIHLGLGYEYDPRVVDALEHALARRHTSGS